MTDFHSGKNYVVVDDGAAKAIVSGRSLLPAGIKSVHGDFDTGTTIGIITADGKEVGAGVTNYSAEDLIRLAGCKTTQIESILGYTYGDEVIHHDYMVVN